MNTNAEKINEIVARMVDWRKEFSDTDKKLTTAKANRDKLAGEYEWAQNLYDELEEKTDRLDSEIEDLKSELDDLWEAATNNYVEDEPKEKTPAKKKGKK